jgi:hypothetical protein
LLFAYLPFALSGTAARVVFFPLFLAAHTASSSSSSSSAADAGFFASDAWSYVLMTMFALTNGYAGTALFMRAAAALPTDGTIEV